MSVADVADTAVVVELRTPVDIRTPWDAVLVLPRTLTRPVYSGVETVSVWINPVTDAARAVVVPVDVLRRLDTLAVFFVADAAVLRLALARDAAARDATVPLDAATRVGVETAVRAVTARDVVPVPARPDVVPIATARDARDVFAAARGDTDAGFTGTTGAGAAGAGVSASASTLNSGSIISSSLYSIMSS